MPAQIRLSNAIDLDLEDTRKNLEYLNAKESLDALDTEDRNRIYSITLCIHKILEKPIRGKEKETFNFYTLIEGCDESDKKSLGKKYTKIVSCTDVDKTSLCKELEKFRDQIVAHRNIKYQNYQTNESELTKYAKYLIANRSKIEKLLDDMKNLLMDIHTSIKKRKGISSNVEPFQIQLIPNHEENTVTVNVNNLYQKTIQEEE